MSKKQTGQGDGLTLVMEEWMKDTQTMTTHSKSSQRQALWLAAPPSATANKLATTTKVNGVTTGIFMMPFARSWPTSSCCPSEHSWNAAAIDYQWFFFSFIWEQIKWGNESQMLQKVWLEDTKAKVNQRQKSPGVCLNYSKKWPPLAAAES